MLEFILMALLTLCLACPAVILLFIAVPIIIYVLYKASKKADEEDIDYITECQPESMIIPEDRIKRHINKLTDGRWNWGLIPQETKDFFKRKMDCFRDDFKEKKRWYREHWKEEMSVVQSTDERLGLTFNKMRYLEKIKPYMEG